MNKKAMAKPLPFLFVDGIIEKIKPFYLHNVLYPNKHKYQNS